MELLESLKAFYDEQLQDNPNEVLQKYILPLEYLHEASNYYLNLLIKVCLKSKAKALPKVRLEVLEKNLKSLNNVLAFRNTPKAYYDLGDCAW